MSIHHIIGGPHICLTIKPLDPLATADGLNLEADLPELLSINDESAIKNEGGLVHALVYVSPVNVAELFPFSGNDDGLSTPASLKSRCRDGHLLFD
jgi:hypothetical protein